MARVVTEIPPRKSPTGRDEMFPYDNWFDGQVWELVTGESDNSDMPIDIKKAASYVAAAGKRRNIKVKVARRGKLLYVQAHFNKDDN